MLAECAGWVARRVTGAQEVLARSHVWSFSFTAPHVPLIRIRLPLLSHVLSSVFDSYSLPFAPLGQINLLCAENLILWSFQGLKKQLKARFPEVFT